MSHTSGIAARNALIPGDLAGNRILHFERKAFEGTSFEADLDFVAAFREFGRVLGVPLFRGNEIVVAKIERNIGTGNRFAINRKCPSRSGGMDHARTDNPS